MTPRADQIAAKNAALKAERGIISMVTASGKSFVIALICRDLNLKTLIIVPTLGLKEQLTESLLVALGPGHKVTVENIDSSALPGLTDFDCLIIDEAHHVAASTYRKLNRTAWKGIYYRYFFTATPFRNDDEEQLLFESIAGQVIYELDYKTAVSKKIIPPIEAYYIEIPKQDTDAYTWKEVYSQLVVNNEIRNDIIRGALFTLAINEKSALCLVKEIAHGNKLAPIIFANGQDDRTSSFIKRFNTREIIILIGTSGILGEGIDSRPAEYVIIAGLGKAKSSFMQQIGRVLRPYPGKESGKVILIKDRSHKFTLRHFNIQCKILKEVYGVKPMKLEIT